MSEKLQTHADNLKQQARRLRTTLAGSGQAISHAQALEAVAKQHGFRDWNTAAAHVPTRAPRPNILRLMPGDRVTGEYLGQPFRGEVRSVNVISKDRLTRISVEFDEAVDVVSFESFSSWRKRVTSQIGPDGVSPQKRSDGTPHMRIGLEGSF
ncbi:MULTISPECIES: glyoxalase superfamily protein [unclassified Minwuia]|jgi:Glyoxalase superfamily protein|uniref:glyoxalase superfamily protein n=1 Tax=unclassified Minwuia TaxID=2618799 RepID=UPI00247AFE44|nr:MULTISPECIES: glyoxalase superfamily protein [unclassified Minwuia]